MLKSKLENVKIKGISVSVPKKELCLIDDETLYNGDKKQLKRVMASSGFNKRRVVDQDTTASDLCEAAAQRLINDMGIDKNTIDGVILVTQTPDYHMPATACVLHKKLGLKKECAAFDINQGCAGYVYGLWVASMMINSGCKRVLLLVGDTSSKVTDMFKEHNSAPIFGDAGSATLIDFDSEAKDIFFDIGTDGTGFDSIISTNGAFRNPPKKDDFYEDGEFKYNAKMDGLRVFNFTLEEVPPSIKSVMDFANVKTENIDYFVLHQANKFILENIAATVDIPLDKVPSETLSKYGNQSCTSIPAAICDMLSEEVRTKALKLLLSGFGIGLSWISIVVDIEKIYCSGIQEYKE